MIAIHLMILAGVGGGATFTAFTVLSIMGLPVWLVSSKLLHELDTDKYNDKNSGQLTGDALEI